MDARLAFVALHHLIGIGPAWHAVRVDEGGDLYVVQSGLRQGIDQFDLAFGRNRAFLELETLARAFFVDLHELGEIGHPGIPPPGALDHGPDECSLPRARPPEGRYPPVR